MMGTGEAEGERRAVDAAEPRSRNPLLEDVSMKGARGVLINITGARHDPVRGRRGRQPDPTKRSDPTPTSSSARPSTRNCRARCASRSSRPDRCRAEPQGDSRPLFTARHRHAGAEHRLYPADADTERRPPRRGRPSRNPRPSPAPMHERVETPEPLAPVAEAAESAALRSGAFIAPRPVDAGPPRQPGAAQPAAPMAPREPQAAGPPARPRAEPHRARSPASVVPAPPRRHRPTPPREQPRTAAPGRPTQPRLAPLDPRNAPARPRKTTSSTSRPSCAARRTRSTIPSPPVGGRGRGPSPALRREVRWERSEPLVESPASSRPSPTPGAEREQTESGLVIRI